jgi:hypothetical protein
MEGEIMEHKPFPWCSLAVVTVVLIVLGGCKATAPNVADKSTDEAKQAAAAPVPGVPGKAIKTTHPGAFGGVWVNGNSEGITKLEITETGTQVTVHALGKCERRDCDFGTQSGTVSGDTAAVAWNQAAVRGPNGVYFLPATSGPLRKMTLSLAQSGRLDVELDTSHEGSIEKGGLQFTRQP